MRYLFLLAVLAIAFGAWLTGRAMTGARPEVSARTATQLYATNCATCHGKDGRAKTMKSKLKYHARNLTDPEWQGKVSDERLFNSITNGKGKMPAFGKKLSDQEIESLITYVRGLKK